MKPVIYGAVVITIIATPWTSFDALIVPKIIALSCLSAYLLPSVIKNYKRFFVDSKQTILLIISIMFMIQMIVVMLVSSAPFEQEFFGRTGRGLGFITYFSLFIVALYTAVNIKFSDIKIVFQGLFLARVLYFCKLCQSSRTTSMVNNSREFTCSLTYSIGVLNLAACC